FIRLQKYKFLAISENIANYLKNMVCCCEQTMLSLKNPSTSSISIPNYPFWIQFLYPIWIIKVLIIK
ncbi:MAG: hypothetical protein II453_01575, partial [Alphaproteobacteria bacterium]|nr:hypothetical protein [Alphaproteobacteria bacterium]